MEDLCRGLEWNVEMKAGIRLNSALKARVEVPIFTPKNSRVKWEGSVQSYRKNCQAMLFCRQLGMRRALG